MTRKSSCSLLLICCLASVTHANAQGFRNAAELDTVPVTGFYQIPVNPLLTSISRFDLSDVRIAAGGGIYVPYIITHPRPSLTTTGAADELKIITSVNEHNYTTIVLGAAGSSLTTGLSLTMRSAAVRRYGQVSGSNDGNEWFIIDDHILLEPGSSDKAGNFTQDISLPGNDYRYFKIRINNAHTDPVNVIAAKAFHQSRTTVSLPEKRLNPAPRISQKDSSNHISYIVIRNDAAYSTDDVRLIVVGPAFYERNVTVSVMASDKDSAALGTSAVSFTLSSKAAAHFPVAPQKVQTIVLQIDNKDNQPVKITAAATASEPQYIVSWLEQGKKYTLLTTNDRVELPQYDLDRFADSIPRQLPLLSYSAFHTVANTAVVADKPKTSMNWLWVGILIAVGGLSFLTFRLMTDIKRSGQQ